MVHTCYLGNTALIIATKLGYLEIVKALATVGIGANVNLKNKVDVLG